ncbi:MAG: outer membrane lipoprotein-sorting protein [Brevinematales bacterium]
MKKIVIIMIFGLLTLSQRGKGVLSDNATLTGFVKGLDKSMVAYTEPVNMKGRKILMIKDDMWIFLPDTKKPVRLTASQRLLGQASNGDVVKVRFDYDYSAVMGGEETAADINSENRSCYKLLLSAKRSGATYHSMVLWVEKETFYPVKAEFFALSGKKLKTAFYSGLKDFDGKNVITKTTIYDEIIKDNYTTIENVILKPAEVEDMYFNKEYLQRM